MPTSLLKGWRNAAATNPLPTPYRYIFNTEPKSRKFPGTIASFPYTALMYSIIYEKERNVLD